MQNKDTNKQGQQPKQQKENESNQSFQYGNKIIHYSLIRSKRRKTSEVIVDENNVIIRVPFYKSIKEIEQILNDKTKWISQKQKEFQMQDPEIVKPTFKDGSKLAYLGNNYELIIHTDNEKEESLQLKGIQFIVTIKKEAHNQENIVRELYNYWLFSEAGKLFIPKVKEFSIMIGVNPGQIVLKNMVNR